MRPYRGGGAAGVVAWCVSDAIRCRKVDIDGDIANMKHILSHAQTDGLQQTDGQAATLCRGATGEVSQTRVPGMQVCGSGPLPAFDSLDSLLGMKSEIEICETDNPTGCQTCSLKINGRPGSQVRGSSERQLPTPVHENPHSSPIVTTAETRSNIDPSTRHLPSPPMRWH